MLGSLFGLGTSALGPHVRVQGLERLLNDFGLACREEAGIAKSAGYEMRSRCSLRRSYGGQLGRLLLTKAWARGLGRLGFTDAGPSQTRGFRKARI